MESSSRIAISSEGGAVFIGDGNAARDIININHITTVRPLARSLYRSFFVSSDQFKSVQSELAALMTVLEAVEEDRTNIQVDCNKEPALQGLSRNCHEILKHLQALKQHFDSMPTHTQRTWEREQWRGAELADIRTRLTITVSSLNMVYTSLVNSSTRRIMEVLEIFINEVRTGKREGSVVTNHTTGSLAADEKEAWRQLRKELESVGITPARFDQHRDLIVARLLEAIKDGDLIEDIGEESSSSPRESTEERLATTTDSMSQSTPIAGTQRTKTPPPPHVRRPIGRLDQIAKLLFRATNGRITSAAVKGDEVLVQKLLESGANVNSKSGGITPLSFAAAHGHEGVVKLLLNTDKVDVDSKDKLGCTPLWWAAANGHDVVVKLLLETGKVDVNSKELFGSMYDNGCTPLNRAAENGHDVVVKLLLETGKVDVNSMDVLSRTPLCWAAAKGHDGIVKLLLGTRKVDVDSKDKLGCTPLWWATKNKHEGVVKMLLDTGKANVHSRDQTGHTPLSLAVEKGHQAIKDLLQRFTEQV